MKPIVLVAAAAAVCVALLAGCASSSNVGQAPPPYLNKVAAMGVAPETMKRLSNARVLTFADVLEMVKKGVPGEKITAYLKSTRAPYNYSQARINQLVDAGADNVLINYVGRSQGDFLLDAQNEPKQQQVLADAKLSKEFWNDPYFGDPGYWGAVPFGYVWPPMWY